MFADDRQMNHGFSFYSAVSRTAYYSRKYGIIFIEKRKNPTYFNLDFLWTVTLRCYVKNTWSFFKRFTFIIPTRPQFLLSILYHEDIRHQENVHQFWPKFIEDHFEEKTFFKSVNKWCLKYRFHGILFEALCSLGNRSKVEVELQVTCLIHVVSYIDCHELF